jgi:hypothetical protein
MGSYAISVVEDNEATIEELDAFPKDLIKLFRNNGDDLETWEKSGKKK